jgi:hypothetical protein
MVISLSDRQEYTTLDYAAIPVCRAELTERLLNGARTAVLLEGGPPFTARLTTWLTADLTPSAQRPRRHSQPVWHAVTDSASTPPDLSVGGL